MNEDYRREKMMNRLKTLACFTLALVVSFVVCAGSGHAAAISGAVDSTLTIGEDSVLVGDVTCTVSGVPCLDIGASNVTLDLNGFSITGQRNPQTGDCPANAGTEQGIRILQQTGVTIRGPGIVQRFGVHGIIINGSTGTHITGVTTSSNCASGILLGGDSNLLENNISIANGSFGAPCGGI
jgi:hypothetical protein